MKNFIIIFFFGWMLNVTGQSVTEMEYWIDVDPGFGQAISISSFPSEDNIEEILTSFNNNLSLGNHAIGFRSKDENGQWSQTNVAQLSILDDIPAGTIESIEYFIDEDPGFGLGLPLSNSFSPDQNISELMDSLSTTVLTVGNHIVGIRSLDYQGRWSHTNYKTLRVIEEHVEKNIVAIEYFWIENNEILNDPNFGVGSQLLNIQEMTNINEFNTSIDVPSEFTSGTEPILMLRSKDSDELWSHTNFVNIVELYPLAADTTFSDANVCDSFISPNGTIIEHDSIYNEPNFDGSQFQINTYNIQITVIDTLVTLSNTPPLLTSNSAEGTYQWLDCSNGNNPIPNATEQSYTPDQSGEFAIQITLNGCVSTSGCHTVNIVSIENFNGHENVLYTFFPNPTRGSLNINVTNTYRNNSLRILDTQGRIVAESILNIGFQQIDLKHLRPATYLIQFINDTGIITDRLIID